MLLFFLACTAGSSDTGATKDTDTGVDTGDTDTGDTDTGDTDTGDTDTGDTDTGDTDTGDTDTGDTDTGDTGDTDTGDTGTACTIVGTYGAPLWKLQVNDDCTAWLSGYCGEGGILTPLPLSGGAFTASFTWTWQGAGPSGGSDAATLEGTVSGGVVDATLTWLSVSAAVQADTSTTPGDGLGVGACPLD